MKPRTPHLTAPATQTGVVTADEFNLWCALNGRPFNLVPNARSDGRPQWDVEVLPGTPRAGTVYSTGLSEEGPAVIAGFAFLAGVEWAVEATPADSAPAAAAAPIPPSATAPGPESMPQAAPAPATPVEPAVVPATAVPAGAAPAAAPVSAAVHAGTPPTSAREALAGVPADAGYRLPPIDLLQTPPPRPPQQHDEGVLARNARQLETVLKNFRVRGEIMEVRPGPVVTLYELEPAPGTKSATVINLTDDIARSMSAVTARIAIVPGRSVIGVELPNPVREMVYLREMLDAPNFRDATANLAIALGKDIGGDPVVADLARMPHLLVAGTTGSGKSVAINTMILSLLYRLPPDRCRFIMVDPKMLELSVYDGIPHLLTPVVTDPKKAVIALRWAVREMENRYEAMSRLGVRNIEGYNARVAELASRGEKLPPRHGEGDTALLDLTSQEPVPLPFIVVIVDEMADLMLVAGKEIEAAIQRLAQMARAAGIHLIMATQRPSVDVITGTIKANFPTRISFQVTSKIDSRTILGEAGAEQLLGQGDMLYMHGGGRITRVHGPFVSDSEVEEIVQFVKAQGAPNYVTAITEEDEEIIAEEEEDTGATGGVSADDLYLQAVNLVVREQKVSVSFIQRQLQIGYNRAARLVERMEQERVVSAANHQGKRDVLMSIAGLSAKRAGV
ncbi:DNA translocase FtsK [Azospirillum halopraeferens]|uniref:DNA translocase FtsK n=1 Tax=Azospirillum halopraeferens TaxID=34010 RepID=UPI0003F976A3|nr:DNA translocase FtsK [Azospirillum halopraeferens]